MTFKDPEDEEFERIEKTQNYKIETIDMAQVYLQEGWYKIKQLQMILDHNKRLNDRLRKEIEETK